jgi:hypothetical protein
MGQPFGLPIHQPIHQPMHQPIDQSMDASVDLPIHQPLASSLTQPMDPPRDQLAALQCWLDARLASLEGEGAFEEAYALRMEMADWLLAEVG